MLSQNIKTEKMILPVQGMTCASCVSRIEKTISGIEGIKNVSVNLATEKASFEFVSGTVDIYVIAKKIEDAGYKLDLSAVEKRSGSDQSSDRQTDAYTEELKRDFITSLIFTLPVLFLNMGLMWEDFFIKNLIDSGQINKILLLLTTPVIFLPGRRFYRIFWNNLKHFTADMNSLVAIGTGSAYAFSLTVTLFPELFAHHQAHVYFDTTAVIITLILLGRWLENRAKSRTGAAVKKLLELQPRSALVRENDKEIEKSIDELETGNIVIVKPGNKIPADGIIISGASGINESMITGESMPVEKTTGSKVIGGTINLNGYFEFRITSIGGNSVLGQIIKLVEDAQNSKAPIQNLADKIASVFVPAVVLISIITFFIWMMIPSAGFNQALLNFIAVLIIACPCALGLATPTALIVGMGKGAQHGVLFKNGESLEELHRAGTIIFDKTGTITEGIVSVGKVYSRDIPEDEFISLLASLERRSEHPIAKAIVNYAGQKNILPKNISDFQALPGKGLTGIYQNKILAAGNESFMDEMKIDSGQLPEIIKRNSDDSSTVIFLALDGKAAGYLTLSDTIKENARQIIDSLKKFKIMPVLLSGDNLNITRQVAERTGIEKFESGVLPQNKAEIISKYQEAGKKVVMVGDGINDAPALARSDVGIAIGTGTDVAIESAGVVLMNGNLEGVIKSIELSRNTIRVVKQNLFWAFIYNVIGIPLAAAGMLNPVFAALAMSLSSLSVVSNSLRLKKMKL